MAMSPGGHPVRVRAGFIGMQPWRPGHGAAGAETPTITLAFRLAASLHSAVGVLVLDICAASRGEAEARRGARELLWGKRLRR